MLFLICASGVSYWLIKKDKISFLKKTTTTTTETTTTEFRVALDTPFVKKTTPNIFAMVMAVLAILGIALGVLLGFLL